MKASSRNITLPSRLAAKSINRDPVHLYRALLRQCTYLPDSFARDWCSRHLRKRFRDYHPPPAHGKWHNNYPPSPERLQKLLHDARRWVRRLEHANAGYIKPLMDVLLLAYGRKGPRRHELLRQLRKPNIPSSSAETEALRDNLKSPKGEAAPSAVSVLVKSQHKRQNMATDRRPIKSLTPKIPETNAWGRPLPRVRYKNQVRKHEKMLLDRILPPLPEHEWTRLQALAWGTETATTPVGKRSNGSGSIRDGLPAEGGRTGPSVSDERPHRITARFMRRLWGKVLVQCPLMKFDFSTRRWTLTWSPAHSPAKDRQIKPKETALESSGITNCNLALFSGVDQRGRLVSTNI